ncbi:MAG: class B sortase, partial [Eubacteriales bacterium]|nr:class B sortase [Eubacteriales bacterium]
TMNDDEDPWVALGWKAPATMQGGAALPMDDSLLYPPMEPQEPVPFPPGIPMDAGAYPPPVADGVGARPYLSPFSEDDLFDTYLPPVDDGDFSKPYRAAAADTSPYRPVEEAYSGSYAPVPPLPPVTPPTAAPSGSSDPPEPEPPAKAVSAPGGANGGGPPRLPSPMRKTPPRDFRQTVKSSWRMALLIACALAVVFTVIEVARMVQSLLVNERQMPTERQKYYAMAGVDPDSAPQGVELLAKGQTYEPTATPQPVQTPTPVPRISQNDPLIGVLDAGGATEDGAQAGQTPEKTQTRTKLSQYPDNLLLSIDSTFAALREQNQDIVGRLVIDGVLDETLVQRNNTYYLTHNCRKNLIEGGAVFVDEGCSLKAPPENLLLRGQTNVAGKLFEPLTLYGTQGAGYVSSHGIVTCDTLYEKAQYVVFAVIYADNRVSSEQYFNYAGYPTFQTDAQMMSFVDSARLHSVYTINVNVQASDRLLTLAALPADGETASWVIICRKLRSGETAGHIQTD